MPKLYGYTKKGWVFKAYIILLLSLGKILDKIINIRLQHQFERTNQIDALREYIKKLQVNKDKGLHQTTVYLDLGNTFNSGLFLGK